MLIAVLENLAPCITECHRKVIPRKWPSMSLQYQTRPLSIQMCHCKLQDDIVSTISIHFFESWNHWIYCIALERFPSCATMLINMEILSLGSQPCQCIQSAAPLVPCFFSVTFLRLTICGCWVKRMKWLEATAAIHFLWLEYTPQYFVSQTSDNCSLEEKATSLRRWKTTSQNQQPPCQVNKKKKHEPAHAFCGRTCVDTNSDCFAFCKDKSIRLACRQVWKHIIRSKSLVCLEGSVSMKIDMWRKQWIYLV